MIIKKVDNSSQKKVFDPKELLNINEKEANISYGLANDLQEILNNKQYIYKPIPPNLNLDEDKKEKLRSLGY